MFFHYREEETYPDILEGMALAGAGLLAQGKTEQCLQMAERAVRKAGEENLVNPDALRVQCAVFLMELEREALRLRGDVRLWGSLFLLWDRFGQAEGLEGLLSWMEENIMKCRRHIFENGEGGIHTSSGQ